MLCLAVGAALLVAHPALASQSVLWQGIAGSPFGIAKPLSPYAEVDGTVDQAVGLKVGELWHIDAGSAGYAELGDSQPDPQSVQALADEDVLIADPGNRLVAELALGGSLVWSYTVADDPGLRLPLCARRLADGATLICDSGADRVFIVAPSGRLGHGGQVIWQYGKTGVAGAGVDLLDDPTSADVLPNGNVAICDAGNHRVIVVRFSHYDSTSADAGFTAGSIVWQYGQKDVAGSGVDQLVRPTSVQACRGGVAGQRAHLRSGGGARPGVRAADYAHGFTAASVVWQYPAPGSQASAPVLVSPSCAVGTYSSDNLVWIADAGRGGVRAWRPTRSQADHPAGTRCLPTTGRATAHRSRAHSRRRRHCPRQTTGAWWWPTAAGKGGRHRR